MALSNPVGTGAAERRSLSLPTVISAASQVDENHQKQAFLCLVVVAPWRWQWSEVSKGIAQSFCPISTSTYVAPVFVHILCSWYSAIGSFWVISIPQCCACCAPTISVCVNSRSAEQKQCPRISASGRLLLGKAEAKHTMHGEIFMKQKFNNQISWMCIEAKCEEECKSKPWSEAN